MPVQTVEDYQGPPPLTDHDYIVGSYHLLTVLGTRITLLDADVEQIKKEVETLKKVDIDQQRLIDLHQRLVIIAGAILTPIVVALITNAIHLHP